MKKIMLQDLLFILARHQGDKLLQQKLNAIEDSEQLLIMLARYVEFNAPFAAGVASLSGALAAQQKLFVDTQGRDQSITVASYVFRAAIDEFGDRTLPSQPTHRSLARLFLEETADILGYSHMLADLAKPTSHMQAASKKVFQGYGVNREQDEYDLFRAIGFHLGSEILAQREFTLLDAFLRQRYPDLVSELEKRRAYVWVARHPHVETEHANDALLAANYAVEYYNRQEEKRRVKEKILKGFDSNACVQETFMEGIS